jgi:hypothetical protein
VRGNLEESQEWVLRADQGGGEMRNLEPTDCPIYGCGIEHKCNDHMPHRFTIPVEWEYAGNSYASYTSQHLEKKSITKQEKRVTKLRCECGKEIER